MKESIIIFDLDGTLIDSAQSIINSLMYAFGELQIVPKKKLTHQMIGPPLEEVISSMISMQDKIYINQIVDKFKKYYDECECTNSKEYTGITEMLQNINKNGNEVNVATNKRIKPAMKIIKALGWENLIQSVFTLDGFEVKIKNKESMLKKIKNLKRYYKKKIIYIGDRVEDMEAARRNGMDFYGVSWGYGELSNDKNNMHCVNSIEQLTKLVKSFE